MPRGPHPILLILALALPASVDALGLGDIHVDSALNEPLSAQIDIVGASLDDLTDLRAAIASLETFQRYGAERPTFLNSATFKIGQNAQGRPVLDVRSRDSFTDPLVSLLVDLKWRNSELVREYSLLLDPAGLSASRRASANAALAKVAVAPRPAAEPITESAAGGSTPAMIAPASIAPASIAPASIAPASIASVHAFDTATHHRITARDTLRGIVRRAGARSETQIQRLMVATFRANPAAFEGNINRLHRGVVLNLPTSAEVDAISAADAKRDVGAQMTAWRAQGRPVSARSLSTQVRTAPQAQAASAGADREQNDAALTSRLQSLEQQLGDLHQQMAKEYANLQQLRQAAAPAAASVPSVPLAPSPVGHSAKAEPMPPSSRAPHNLNMLLGLTALLLGAALAGYGYFRKRLQRPAALRATSAVDAATLATTAAPAATAPTAASGESSRAAVGLVSRQDTALQSDASLSRSAQAADALRAAPTPAPVAQPGLAPAASQWPPRSAGDTTTGMAVEVDAEALERSYLESLGFNTSGFGKDGSGEFQFAKNTGETAATTLESIVPTVAALARTTEIEMSEVEEMEADETEVNTAVIKVDATTLAVRASAELVAVDTAASATTELDFNLSDLDATAQHVQMPSALNDRAEVSESRTNIVDVLKMAIDRDPHRRDLRMKLVETYYNAASGNRRAFMEVVRKLAREREYLSTDEWNKIVRMGREIAPDDILFTDLVKDADDVAA